MNPTQIRNIVEAALMAAGRPLSLDQLLALFSDAERPDRQALRAAINMLQAEYAGRGIDLNEVASGFRIQIKSQYSEWISRLWQERPPRYSRALMETLALIAYRQPITRGEIEEIRGVSVSTNIMRTMLERGWVRVVGYRDVPGKPGMYGTTREFLDYFGLKRLDELPTLSELKDLDSLNVELDLQDPDTPHFEERPADPEEEAEQQLQSLEEESLEGESLEGEAVDEYAETEVLEPQPVEPEDELTAPTGDTQTVRVLGEPNQPREVGDIGGTTMRIRDRTPTLTEADLADDVPDAAGGSGDKTSG